MVFYSVVTGERCRAIMALLFTGIYGCQGFKDIYFAPQGGEKWIQQ